MAKISRWKQLIFGKTGDTSEFGKIGSDTVGSPENTKDPAAIQSLAGYLSGLFSITNSGVEAPRLEDLNSLFYIITQQLAYILEAGTPEWLATQEYWIGSRARVGSKVYMSLSGEGEAPNINNNPVSDSVNWRDLDAYYRNAANLTGTLNLDRLPTVLTGKKIGFTELADVALEAAKWTTPRTLSLTGAVSGSGNIDGSGNVNIITQSQYALAVKAGAFFPTVSTSFPLKIVLFNHTASTTTFLTLTSPYTVPANCIAFVF